MASAVALTRDLLNMKNLSAVNAVLAALGRAAVKGLDATSLKAAGFDAAACAAVGCSWAEMTTAGFTAAEANKMTLIVKFGNAVSFVIVSCKNQQPPPPPPPPTPPPTTISHTSLLTPHS
jgi:hypothetical protein